MENRPLLVHQMMLLEVVAYPPRSCSIPVTGFSVMEFPYFLSTDEMALYVLETFDWCLRSAACPSRPFPEDYRDLCLNFVLSDAEEAARDFRIPEMGHAIFCVMVVNDGLKLDVLSRDLAKHLKSALVGLR